MWTFRATLVLWDRGFGGKDDLGALLIVRFGNKSRDWWGHVIDDRTKNIRQNRNEVEDCVILVGKFRMYLKTLRASISALSPQHPSPLKQGFM